MSRFNLNRNSLQKAESPLRQYGWRGTQFQVKLVRQKLENGKYRTKSQIIRGKREYHGNNRGLLHKAVNLKYRIKGDAPSVTKQIKSIKPYTVKGQIAKGTAFGAYKVTKAGSKAAISTALAAETAAVKLGDEGVRTAKNYLQQKYNSEAVDDFNRGTLASSRVAVEAAKGVHNHFKQKKQHKTEKKFNKKNFKNQRKISRYSASGLLALKPLKYTGNRMTASAWQKTVHADENNDFLHAADSAKRNIYDRVKQYSSKQSKLHRQEKKRDKLQNKEGKQNRKLHSQERKLQKRKSANYNTSKLKKKTSGSKSLLSSFKETIILLGKKLKNPFSKEARNFLISILTPVMLILLVLMFLMMMFSSCVSSSTWILGTYATQDYDLTKSVEYYTKLANDMNNKIIKVGTTDWKSGLSSLGADTSNMDDTPTEYIWGRSSQFNYDPVWDFDVFKLYSFLCAYYYDFSADADNGDILYWNYKTSTETVLKELFNAQYKFEYYYDNSSGWERLNEYTFPNQDGYQICYGCGTTSRDGTIYGRIDCNTVPNNLLGFAEYDESDSTYTILYSIDNLEIINAQDGYSATGWYMQDLRNTITDPSGNTQKPLYFYDDDGKCYFKSLGYPIYRSYYDLELKDGSLLQEDHGVIMASPNDVAILKYPKEGIINKYAPDTNAILDAMNGAGNIIPSDYDYRGWYKYFQMYEWVEDCRLYYNVKQLKTFDKAIEDKLKSMDDGSERYAYYQLLVGDDEKAGGLFGNHQTLHWMFEGESKSSYISDGKIIHGYGYDIQEWNSKHCNLYGLHTGMDVLCPAGSPVYSPLECKIQTYDESNQKIILRQDDVDYWYDGEDGEYRDTEITIQNVKLLDGYKVGDKLKYDEEFAVSTAQQRCGSTGNSGIGSYVHVQVNVDTDGYGWDMIDPQLVFY